MSKIKHFRFLALFVCSIILIILSITNAEQYNWDCPNCGRTGNSGNYCGACAYTAPWIPTDSPTITVTPPVSEQIPNLFEMYPNIKTHLKANEERWYTQFGPGQDYAKTSHGYKTDSNHSNTISIFFCENEWLFADIVYSSASEKYAYLPKNSVVDSDQIVQISALDSFDGITKTDVIPYWGPGNSFDQNTDCKITENTKIKAFFQENGYVYCEFVCTLGKVRMWLPLYTISF